ncbi:MAG TPA: chloride channel protein [Candidatus Saccharimonadales bacterium]|nr:chloride channel protein [Candidatus Saccharimonadales bacterium]
MKRLWLLVATGFVGVIVALVYCYFEAAVHHGINLVWADWLDTGAHRWLVVPICLVVSLVFFGLQHYLDSSSEHNESHGLGEAPKPTLTNFAKVLFLGFWSLVAGASLGPEAILVPACMIAGGYIGAKAFKHDGRGVKILGAAGFIALMAAFFHSFIAGMLGLLLIKKQTKAPLNIFTVLVAVVASWATVYILGLLSSPAFVSTPSSGWHFNTHSLLALAILVVAGYAVTYGLGASHGLITRLHQRIAGSQWWLRSLAAAAGLSALYLLGGTLVEFTGNKSIVPMLKQAASLGVAGLLWITVVKIVAISWSKAMGYRGGLIFPTVFVASVLVAIAKLHVPELNFIYGLIAVLVGVFAAERRVKILF